MGALAVTQLPSFDELVHRFSLFDSSTTSGCNVQIGANGSIFCKCEGCIEWRDFVEGCDSSDSEVKYEVFTQEHVNGLARYLRARAVEYELPVMNVLEVGAGSGHLSTHLNEILSKLFRDTQGPEVRVLATDSGLRGINGPSVKEEDAIRAIYASEAHIIISSWMPRGIDWTAHMRAERSVHEYILIGEIDNGICGCPWKTWGFYPVWDSSDSDNSEESNDSEHGDLQSQLEVSAFHVPHHKSPCESTGFPQDLQTLRKQVLNIPVRPPTIQKDQQLEVLVFKSFEVDTEIPNMTLPNNSIHGIGESTVKVGTERASREKPQYEIDGWERVELKYLSSLQLCRTDERWSTNRHSHTISFRRKIIQND